MSIYSDKLAHVQVVINCRYSIAQMCTLEDIHVPLLSWSSLLNPEGRKNDLTTKKAKTIRLNSTVMNIIFGPIYLKSILTC